MRCSRGSARELDHQDAAGAPAAARGDADAAAHAHIPARLAVRMAGDRAHFPAHLLPVAKGLGYDMVWFGCIVAVVLQTAFLSPPVAMSAYYLKQVVREWNLRLIYRGMADFMVIQCICVALVIIFPRSRCGFRRRCRRRRARRRFPRSTRRSSISSARRHQVAGGRRLGILREQEIAWPGRSCASTGAGLEGSTFENLRAPGTLRQILGMLPRRLLAAKAI